MKHAEAAQTILAQGMSHVLQGVTLQVTVFQPCKPLATEDPQESDARGSGDEAVGLRSGGSLNRRATKGGAKRRDAFEKNDRVVAAPPHSQEVTWATNKLPQVSFDSGVGPELRTQFVAPSSKMADARTVQETNFCADDKSSRSGSRGGNGSAANNVLKGSLFGGQQWPVTAEFPSSSRGSESSKVQKVPPSSSHGVDRSALGWSVLAEELQSLLRMVDGLRDVGDCPVDHAMQAIVLAKMAQRSLAQVERNCHLTMAKLPLYAPPISPLGQDTAPEPFCVPEPAVVHVPKLAMGRVPEPAVVSVLSSPPAAEPTPPVAPIAHPVKWQPRQRKARPISNERDQQSRDTLRSHLIQLKDEDPSHIFIARRIHKLGFVSREILRQHFSLYGEVSAVLVAHSMVKPCKDSGNEFRRRPGGLGLVVMKSAAGVLAILALGEDQTVNGHQIRVQSFLRPSMFKARGSDEERAYLVNANPMSEMSTTVGSNSNNSRSDGSSSHTTESQEDSSVEAEVGAKSDADSDTWN